MSASLSWETSLSLPMRFLSVGSSLKLNGSVRFSLCGTELMSGNPGRKKVKSKSKKYCNVIHTPLKPLPIAQDNPRYAHPGVLKQITHAHMNKTHCLTDTPTRDLPKLHSFAALICGIHLSGVCVLPAGDDKYEYGLRKIVKHLFQDCPLAAVGLTKEECYANNQVVWKEEEL
jgi:hypothetical protein